MDSGTDHDAGMYYVVLRWVPVSLKDWLATVTEPPGWDDVAEVIACLASALAHSHSMAVLHRDINLPNVLRDGEKPLLADFALSKIKDELAGATEATVAGMASAPWAPPDLASRARKLATASSGESSAERRFSSRSRPFHCFTQVSRSAGVVGAGYTATGESQCETS